MNDKLKQFIDDNRDAFDSEDPGPELLKKLKKQLSHDPKPVRIYTMRRAWLAAAVAGIIVLSVVLYYAIQKKDNKDNRVIAKIETPDETISIPDPTYAKQIGYYKELIGLQQTQLKQIGKEQPELYEQFTGDMNTLDSAYTILKTKLAEKTNTEILLEAMIRNLQLQTDLLNRQLMIIKEIKQKSKAHEKNAI